MKNSTTSPLASCNLIFAAMLVPGMNQGSRQNLVYNRNGEIVYPAACAGVVMTKCTKPQQNRQVYNLDHTQVKSSFACRT